jgi:hypothetical protein
MIEHHAEVAELDLGAAFGCPYRKLESRVAMMEAGNHRLGDDPAA